MGHEDTLFVTEICLIWKGIAMDFEYFHPFPCLHGQSGHSLDRSSAGGSEMGWGGTAELVR